VTKFWRMIAHQMLQRSGRSHASGIATLRFTTKDLEDLIRFVALCPARKNCRENVDVFEFARDFGSTNVRVSVAVDPVLRVSVRHQLREASVVHDSTAQKAFANTVKLAPLVKGKRVT
jgi:hypothetical protein